MVKSYIFKIVRWYTTDFSDRPELNGKCKLRIIDLRKVSNIIISNNDFATAANSLCMRISTH